MKVFVTGASGFIGSAVSRELARAGHEVRGLVRSAAKAPALAAHEVLPVVGTMQEPEGWLPAARSSQVLVHCAAEPSARYHELDRKTVETLLASAHEARSPRLFVYTSGVWLYGSTGDRSVDESAPLAPPALVQPRLETEKRVFAGNQGSVRTIVLRPGCVYGASGSLTAKWFESAQKSGSAQVVGDGTNRWAMIHVEDLAHLYRLAIESPFGGEVFNASDRSRFTVGECAAAASRAAGAGPIEAVPLAEATKQMGALAECLALSQHADASKAARWLGWQPRHAGFVDGIERYHAAWEASQAS